LQTFPLKWFPELYDTSTRPKPHRILTQILTARGRQPHRSPDTLKSIENKQGEIAMSDHCDPETLLKLAEYKRRDFYQEREAIRLAKEARSHQPGRIRTILIPVIGLFKPLLLKLKNRFGRTLYEKVIAARAQASLRSTHLGL
jgi:hypothetical protein